MLRIIKLKLETKYKLYNQSLNKIFENSKLIKKVKIIIIKYLVLLNWTFSTYFICVSYYLMRISIQTYIMIKHYDQREYQSKYYDWVVTQNHSTENFYFLINFRNQTILLENQFYVRKTKRALNSPNLYYEMIVCNKFYSQNKIRCT